MSAVIPDQVRRQEKHWQDTTGWTYQEKAFAKAGTRLVLEQQFERIANALELAPDHRLLELGCGTGHLMHWLQQRGARQITGVDVSTSCLERARLAGGDIRLLTGDAECLAFRDHSFDRIVCNGSAHHFLDLDAATREIARTLAPGGRLVLHEPVATPVAERLRQTFFPNSRWESPADLAHKHEFTREGLRAALTNCGFINIQMSVHDCFAYPLSGMYMTLPWSGSRAVMGSLIAIERNMLRAWPLRKVSDLFTWRLLVVAERPARAAA